MIRFWFGPGDVMPPPSTGAPEVCVISSLNLGGEWDRLAALEHEAGKVLAGLDELGLHQAAAYLAMAIDSMRTARPDALPTG